MAKELRESTKREKKKDRKKLNKDKKKKSIHDLGGSFKSIDSDRSHSWKDDQSSTSGSVGSVSSCSCLSSFEVNLQYDATGIDQEELNKLYLKIEELNLIIINLRAKLDNKEPATIINKDDSEEVRRLKLIIVDLEARIKELEELIKKQKGEIDGFIIEIKNLKIYIKKLEAEI